MIVIVIMHTSSIHLPCRYIKIRRTVENAATSDEHTFVLVRIDRERSPSNSLPVYENVFQNKSS